MNQAEIQRSLKKCGVLETAGDADLEWLADRTVPEAYDEHEVVFEAGETSTRVYIVAEGSLQVLLGDSSRLVSFAEAGGLFGEYAMFVKGARTASAVAAKPSVLLSIDEADFREFLLRCPTVMMELLQTAVRRLYRIERKRG